ncbi:GIM3 (YNL153C) [Zygosaccharomyces parabailii]|nr:GIM3 (YNL153C) [Zygosaccharomyces parabailii]CDH09202.1 probable Prefoldin subunit 4 [Zygosaccharomyces bailii ISA1307]
MQMLPEGQKNNTNVTYEDQQKINQFSKLIMRKDAVEQELSQHRQEKEYLDDVSLEIELIDEDEPVQYKIGVIFLVLKQHEVVKQLENDMDTVEESISHLETQSDQLETQIRELKTVLYAKFGDNINLER